MTKEERLNKFLKEHPDFSFTNTKLVKKRNCIKCKNIFNPKTGKNIICLSCKTKFIRKRKKQTPEEYRKKQYVRWHVWYALKMGRLIKPEVCQNCNNKLPLQGHHEDYSKPLVVMWLCGICHGQADRILQNKVF